VPAWAHVQTDREDCSEGDTHDQRECGFQRRQAFAEIHRDPETQIARERDKHLRRTAPRLQVQRERNTKDRSGKPRPTSSEVLVNGLAFTGRGAPILEVGGKPDDGEQGNREPEKLVGSMVERTDAGIDDVDRGKPEREH